jgi:hypothetical protein
MPGFLFLSIVEVVLNCGKKAARGLCHCAGTRSLVLNTPQLPPGSGRDPLQRKIRQLETALHINEWASSPELQPPKLA